MRGFSVASALSLLAVSALAQPPRAPEHGRRSPRLIIRNATVVEGNGTPAAGPKDIVIEDGIITDIVALDPVALIRGVGRRPAGEVEIEARGKYLLPGFINLHGHAHEDREGVPLPVDYVLKLWLACGITTVRDVGSNTPNTLALRAKSHSGELAAPRLFVYPFFGRPRNSEQARARVREIKAQGADGIKLMGIHRDVMEATLDEAKKLGLPVAHHTGVEETNAWDDARFGATSIEHWYGVPDAALKDGVQNFPPAYNYNDEVDRFRYAGRLWREADWDRLMKVFDALIAAGVAWDPTLSIYEASRDLQRAQTSPWFTEYLHPTLENYFKPNPAHHGSYFLNWTSTDETFWKENYKIWMRALVEFERRGGAIWTGEDAGYIYRVYGFGLLRELELHQEAGFHPLKVIQHATVNGAKILGQPERLGRVRAGWTADLIVVNGNPLEDLKVLYPGGVERLENGKVVRTGGIEWTIKGGIPYRVPALLADLREIVARARKERPSPSSSGSR